MYPPLILPFLLFNFSLLRRPTKPNKPIYTPLQLVAKTKLVFLCIKVRERTLNFDISVPRWLVLS